MKNRQQDFLHFREKHPVFSYLDFSWGVHGETLKVRYHFSDGQHDFFPEYTFPFSGEARKRYPQQHESAIVNFLFHIGLCEVISYWKSSCAPVLDIHPFCLDEEAERWWKKLFYNGLGEFRYLNGIECEESDFIQFRYSSEKKFQTLHTTDNEGVLLPIGGGKDSAVTLELLSQTVGREDITPFTLNGIPASQRTIVQAGFSLEKNINVTRKLDPALLELNANGYLNGHTPFSALLAFVTLFTAVLHKKRDIALSNESSANEATIPGTNINHQYSKSFEFETDFRKYYQQYMASGVNYYSFLRAYTESDIAKIFATFPQHFFSFRSCNVGSKSDVWCCNCSKCLFVWIILSPYLSVEQLTAIFGQDLGADFHLLEDFKKLCGVSPEKPFECVGTIEEVRNSIIAAYHNGHSENVLYQYFINRQTP
jgi:hypothetical protein